MWSFLRGEPDTVTRWFRWLIAAGFLVGFASVRFNLPGVITAFFLMYLGASGGGLIHWRNERGLWMLAVLFLAVNIAIYGLFAVGQVRDIVRGARPADIGLIADFSLGTTLLAVCIRFLCQVARYNWNLSR
jgi:hypothetical protein